MTVSLSSGRRMSAMPSSDSQTVGQKKNSPSSASTL